MRPPIRNLVLILGDQLDEQSAALDDFDPRADLLWMAEVEEEATHVWSHKARIALFLTAMRHFREALRARGVPIFYRQLDAPAGSHSFASELASAITRWRPKKLIVLQPGEWRVEQSLRQTARAAGVPLDIRPDRHFLCSREEFAAHVAHRRQLRMEFFYREMRRKHGALMEGDQPAGGAWNFDAENRRSFGKDGAPEILPPTAFAPDHLTRGVLELVERHFPKHPGSLKQFDWPVTPAQAREALADFIMHRLPQFGAYQDAMWASSGLPAHTARRDAFLFHSRLSAALNLKLLQPREVIAAAEEAYRAGRVPLASAEGFIRQILGWREYVRGVYWRYMPEYLERNALDARLPLPGFYWTGATDMNCLRTVINQTLQFGYAHHIQRLMVTGLFALLLGVSPRAVHAWYLAVYVDAIEWVELPNTLGMSQYADGGLMASKPYVASGRYIQRMSNYCAGCRYDPALPTGERACPFTTLYWNFLLRHEHALAANQRMAMQLRNLGRLGPEERLAIQRLADKIKDQSLSQ